MKVPEVLLSGDHEKVKMWHKKEALKKTLQNRPDLLNWSELAEEEKKWMEEKEENKISE